MLGVPRQRLMRVLRWQPSWAMRPGLLLYLSTWPTPNCNNAGDGVNYSCFNWSGPISDKANVYIAKMDYNITRDAKHRISVTGALRNENNARSPFLPGQAPSQAIVNYNKGIIVNYIGTITNSLVDSFRYGFIRESDGFIGNSSQDWNYFRGLNNQTGPPGAITRTHSFQRPINSFSDDLTWIKGRHTLQFRGLISIIRTPSVSYESSYSDGSANASWTTLSGYAAKKSPLNPAYTCGTSQASSCVANGNPFVDPDFANSYDFDSPRLLPDNTLDPKQYPCGTAPSVNVIPTQDLKCNTIFLPAPPAVFPQTFPAGNFFIGDSIDAGLKTPYSYTFDFSIAREFKGGFSLEASYVGRLGQRLLTQLDPAIPLNLRDKATGIDYFTATTALAKIYRTGEQTQNFNASQVSPQVAQFWANTIAPLQHGDAYTVSSCDPTDLAEFLRASWEGAILRMKVERGPAAIDRFKKIVFQTTLRE
jgi:hypothetical protein